MTLNVSSSSTTTTTALVFFFYCSNAASTLVAVAWSTIHSTAAPCVSTLWHGSSPPGALAYAFLRMSTSNSISAFAPPPAATNTTRRAALTVVRVRVTRQGGGLGESESDATRSGDCRESHKSHVRVTCESGQSRRLDATRRDSTHLEQLVPREQRAAVPVGPHSQ